MASIRSARVGAMTAAFGLALFSTEVFMKLNVSIPAAFTNGKDEPVPNKVRGQDVAIAAYNTVHTHEAGVKALAARMAISPNTLAHKVNPQNGTHHLTLREAVEMQYQSGNFAILHAMADELGHTCTLATPAQHEGNPVDTLMHLQMEFADFVRSLADAVRGGEGAVTGNQMRRAEHHAQETVAAVGHALALLRARMRAVPAA